MGLPPPRHRPALAESTARAAAALWRLGMCLLSRRTEAGARSGAVLPLAFAFVITYYTERPDLLRRSDQEGAFTFCFLLLLAAYFLVIAPFLLRLWWGTRTAVLAWALLVLPIVLLAPWGQQKLSSGSTGSSWAAASFRRRPVSTS